MTIRKFSKKSIVAVISVTLCLLVSTIWFLGFGIAKRITIVDGDKELHVATMSETVADVLKEHEISLNDGDLIAPPLTQSLDNTSVIVITRSKKINLFIDNEPAEFHSRCNTVGDFLKEAGIELSQYDEISPSVCDVLKNNMTIEILRGKKVTVTVDGNTFERYTTKATVADFLNDVAVYLEQYDEITPYLETKITDGLDVVISRVTVTNETYEESIARNVITRDSSSYTKGTSVVSQEGSDGTAKNTYKIIKRNGQIVSKTLVDSVVITPAVDKIILNGTKNNIKLTSRGGVSYKKVITCTATAYTAGGKTYTGRPAQYGVVAVDPQVIPLNSRLYIESTDDGKTWTYGYAIAADTGGAIKGKIVDLCYSSRSECINFGRRQCKVYILD